MSTGAEVARQSVRSTFLLTVGNLGSTGLLTVTVLVIARLLGPDGYGQYTLALLVPGFLQLLVGFGVNGAIIRYSAFHLSRGETDIAKRMIKNAIAFLFVFGIFLSLVDFFGAGFFSSDILQRPALTPFVQLASISIIGVTLLQAVTAAFIGWNLSGSAGGWAIAQAAIKMVISPVAVLAGFGVFGAVFGHVVSYLVAGSIATTIFYFLRLRSNSGKTIANPTGQRPEQVSKEENSNQPNDSKHEKIGFVEDIRKMTVYGLPYFAANIVSSFSGQYYTIIVLALVEANATIGYYQAALNVTQSISLISSAVAAALFPAFARLDGINADTKSAFTHSVRYVALFITPLVLFVLGTSNMLVLLFYGIDYAPATEYMSLLVLTFLPLALGLSIFPSFFNGIGKVRLNMALSIAGAVVIFVGAPITTLVWGLGVNGLIYVLILENVISTFLGIYFARKYAGANVDYVASARIFLVSCFGYAAILVVSLFQYGPYLTLAIDIILFTAIYLSLLPVLQAISTRDLDSLKISTSGLGVISKIIRPFLRYEEFLIRKTWGKRLTKQNAAPNSPRS